MSRTIKRNQTVKNKINDKIFPKIYFKISFTFKLKIFFYLKKREKKTVLSSKEKFSKVNLIIAKTFISV